MKTILILMVAVLVAVLTGCSTNPIAVAPVGPNPALSGHSVSEGTLQVFSNIIGHSRGDNPPWYQHADYYIYDLQGTLLKHVNNTIGYYESAPRMVPLHAGTYLVKAPANDYMWVKVPVTIKGGQTTRVHLDDKWIPPAGTPNGLVIRMPNGEPVGWRHDNL
jgi:hypothetical protein